MRLCPAFSACAVLLSLGSVGAQTSGIGDAIASGIGFSSTYTSRPSTYYNSTASTSPSRATINSNANSTTSWPSGETGTVSTIDGSICTLITVFEPTCNSSTSLSYGTDCWDAWNTYWDASTSSRTGCPSYVQTFCDEVTPYITTLTSYDGYSIPSDQQTVSFTATVTSTTTIVDGAFGLATSTTTFTTVEDSFIYYSPTATYIITVNHTITRQNAVGTVSTIPGITPPPCALPTHVPSCQSAWDSYVSYTPANASGSHTAPTCSDHLIPSCSSSWSSYYYVAENARGVWWNDVSSVFDNYNVWPSRMYGPACTQASVGSDACNSIQSDLATAVALGNLTAWRTVRETPTTGFDLSFHTVWPSNFSFAPSCTLGCSACRITGGSVKLLYWPPATSAENTPTETGPVTAMYGSVTLTSPTVYVSFHEVHAADSCGALGGTYSDTVIPLRTSTDLSSLYGFNWYYPPNLSTAPFNYSDLVKTPVPDSIYNSQPRCASSSFSWSAFPELNTANSSTFSCDRIRPYEPILSVPIEVRDLDPAWKNCFGAIEGIYDPPTALQPVATLAGPSLYPAGGTTTTATPAGVPQPTTPTPTASPPSAAADSLPAPSVPIAVSPTATTQPDATPPDATQPDATSAELESSAVVTQDGGVAASVSGNSAASFPTTVNAGGVVASILGNNAASSRTTVDAGGVVSSSLANSAGQAGADPSGDSADPIATAGGQTIIQDPSHPGAVVVAGQTLVPGGAGVSLASVGNVQVLPGNSLAIGGSVIALPAVADPTAAAVVFLGRTMETVAVTSGQAVVGGQTLSVNGPAATISGIEVSLLSSSIVVDGATKSLSQVDHTTEGMASAGAAQVITTDGKTVSLIHDASGAVVFEDASSSATIADGDVTVFDALTVSASGGAVALSTSSAATLTSLGAAHPTSSTASAASGSVAQGGTASSNLWICFTLIVVNVFMWRG